MTIGRLESQVSPDDWLNKEVKGRRWCVIWPRAKHQRHGFRCCAIKSNKCRPFRQRRFGNSTVTFRQSDKKRRRWCVSNQKCTNATHSSLASLGLLATVIEPDIEAIDYGDNTLERFSACGLCLAPAGFSSSSDLGPCGSAHLAFSSALRSRFSFGLGPSGLLSRGDSCSSSRAHLASAC